MSRKKQRRYKLLAPAVVTPSVPQRQLDAATLVRWAGGFFAAGLLVALLLIASLFTTFSLRPQLWLDVWPSSLRLMTSPGLSGHQATHLALWLAGENGLFYGLIGILVGGAHVLLRTLVRSFRRRPA